MEIKKEERIDELGCAGLKIIQNKQGFCFGIDSVLLSDYAKEIKPGSNVVDLGTGTGIIATLLCGKTKLAKITGVEIQQEVYDMAVRSIQLNHLEERFEILHKDIKEIDKVLPMGSFDAVVSNPPYKKQATGVPNDNEKQLISRQETTATLEDFITVASKLLKEKGNFYLVHRPDRLVDIVTLLRNAKLEPKRMRFVSPYEAKAPNLVLIQATKNANPFLTVEKPLYVYETTGEYTQEILKIYEKEINK